MNETIEWVEMKDGLPQYGRQVLILKKTGQLEIAALQLKQNPMKYGYGTGINMWKPGFGYPMALDKVVAWLPIPRRRAVRKDTVEAAGDGE